MSKKKLKKRLKKLEQWRAKHELKYNDTVTLVTSYKVEVSRLHEKLNKLEQKEDEILASQIANKETITDKRIEGADKSAKEIQERVYIAESLNKLESQVFQLQKEYKALSGNFKRLEEANVNLGKRLAQLEMYKRLEDNPTRRH